MILVSEKGLVREASADPLDAKTREARDEFGKVLWGWYDNATPRVVIVPRGYMHREPRKVRYSRGIDDMLA